MYGKGQETLLRNCFLFWLSPGMMFFLPWQYSPDPNLWELGVFGVLVLSILPMWSSLENLTSLSLAEPQSRKDKEGEASARSYESGLHSSHWRLCALSHSQWTLQNLDVNSWRSCHVYWWPVKRKLLNKEPSIWRLEIISTSFSKDIASKTNYLDQCWHCPKGSIPFYSIKWEY